MDSLEPPADEDLHAQADLTFGPCGDPDCPTGASLPRIGAVSPVEPGEIRQSDADQTSRHLRIIR